MNKIQIGVMCGEAKIFDNYIRSLLVFDDAKINKMNRTVETDKCQFVCVTNMEHSRGRRFHFLVLEYGWQDNFTHEDILFHRMRLR